MMELRLVRVDDFIAESLENRAIQMPPGDDADYTRKLAGLFRSSGRTAMLRVWEVPKMETSGGAGLTQGLVTVVRLDKGQSVKEIE